MKKCLNCQAENSDNAKFCHQCGEPLSDYNLRCPRCNEISKISAKVCPKCGYRFTSIGDLKTQSIQTFTDVEVDEEVYENEQKSIKQKVYNSRIKELTNEKHNPNEKVMEFVEDYTSDKSLISPKTMLRVEKGAHIGRFIISLLLLIFGLIVFFTPLVSIAGWENPLNFEHIFVGTWGSIVKSFSYGHFGVGIFLCIGPLLEFLSGVAFLGFSIFAFFYILIKGIKNFKEEKYKNNSNFFVLIALILMLCLLVSISLNFPVEEILGGISSYLIITSIFVILDCFYQVFKSTVVANKIISIRRGLFSLSVALGIGSLVIFTYQILAAEIGSYSPQSYINDLMVNVAGGNNEPSLYTGFIGYFLYIVNAIFIGITTIYLYLDIKEYNRYRFMSMLMSSLSLGINAFVLILFIVSTSLSKLEVVIEVSSSLIVAIIFSLLIFIFTLISFIFLKDEKLDALKESEIKDTNFYKEVEALSINDSNNDVDNN